MKAVIVATLLLPISAQAQTVTGNWLTDDRSAIVHVSACGAHLCGTVARVLDPAAPARDINNPDTARRARPLVGVQVLLGLSRDGKGWSGGTAYDPKAGRSYRAKVAADGANTLKVTGCILILCRTRRWTRVQ